MDSNTTDKALTYTGRYQAATFLWLLSFERKESNIHERFILLTAFPNEELMGDLTKGIASFLAMTPGEDIV